MADVYSVLDRHGVRYERCDHPAVYTVAEAARLVPDLPAAHTKNLFLRDKKGKRHFLVTLPAEKQIDLRSLEPILGSTKLSLGSPERLQKHLGIEPGAVSLLAIMNDEAGAVEVFIDEDLWHADAFQCHPLVNTSTLVIQRQDIERFLEATRHPLKLVKIPPRQP